MKPEFKFEVIRRHKDPMSRLLHEAVKIESEGELNSKSEWRGPVKPRLQVEIPEWRNRRLKAEEDRRDKIEKDKIQQLKQRVDICRSNNNQTGTTDPGEAREPKTPDHSGIPEPGTQDTRSENSPDDTWAAGTTKIPVRKPMKTEQEKRPPGAMISKEVREEKRLRHYDTAHINRERQTKLDLGDRQGQILLSMAYQKDKVDRSTDSVIGQSGEPAQAELSKNSNPRPDSQIDQGEWTLDSAIGSTVGNLEYTILLDREVEVNSHQNQYSRIEKTETNKTKPRENTQNSQHSQPAIMPRDDRLPEEVTEVSTKSIKHKQCGIETLQYPTKTIGTGPVSPNMCSASVDCLACFFPKPLLSIIFMLKLL